MREPGKKRGLSRRAVGLLQDAVIVILVAVAVLLATSGGTLDLSGKLDQAVQGNSSPSGAGGYSEAAKPLSFMLTPETGVHCSVMYDGDALELAYERYSTTLAEALGSSGAPEKIDWESWESALHGTGIYFDYYGDFQLSILAIWLGTEITGEAAGHSARRFCLSVEGDDVYLYYIRERGTYSAYRCETAVPASQLMSRLVECKPNGAEFNFELDRPYYGVDSYSIIAQGDLRLPSVSSENSLHSANTNELMSTLGMNPYLALSYPESDGGSVMIEGEATLRLGADGELRFSRRITDEEGDVARLSPSDAIEFARRLVDDMAGNSCGEAELWLSYAYFDRESEEYTFRFDYVLNGLPVSIPRRESAVELHIRGKTVSYASILFRSYSTTGAMETPLPAYLALTLVEADGGGEPVLSYSDDLERVKIDWIR